MNSKTVLIVDSDPDKLRVLETLLDPLDLTVVRCLDPSRVGDHLYPTVPDVVIASTHLKGLSSLSLLTLIRARIIYAPIVFIHWNDHPQPMDNLLWHGADDVLSEKELPALTPLVKLLARIRR